MTLVMTKALLEDLEKLRTESPETKSLVYSQFNRFLDLVAFVLAEKGLFPSTFPLAEFFLDNSN